eukprot:scaffold110730_cov19-Tisochrysis_lutea.AAC.3
MGKVAMVTWPSLMWPWCGGSGASFTTAGYPPTPAYGFVGGVISSANGGSKSGGVLSGPALQPLHVLPCFVSAATTPGCSQHTSTSQPGTGEAQHKCANWRIRWWRAPAEGVLRCVHAGCDIRHAGACCIHSHAKSSVGGTPVVCENVVS